MENASKALLIAGAILLVIAIIGIGMAIFTQAQGIVGDSSKQLDALAVQAHNSMFDSYMDKTNVKGKQIKELCSRIANYNQTADNNYSVTIYKGTTVSDTILVQGWISGSSASVTLGITDKLSDKTIIDANKNYEVTGSLDTNTGIYTKIFISDAN